MILKRPCDPVSSRVLVLNLVLRGDAAACRLTAAAGPEPPWLTWRSLSGPFGCDAPDVYVCENPSVLIAAADQLGADALPLVCTNGRPSAAVRLLLTGLASGGTTIHARADDDPAGRDIVAALPRRDPVTAPVAICRYPCRPATLRGTRPPAPPARPPRTQHLRL
jgi:uncharacterized protein (TIGR02679 family)